MPHSEKSILNSRVEDASQRSAGLIYLQIAYTSAAAKTHSQQAHQNGWKNIENWIIQFQSFRIM